MIACFVIVEESLAEVPEAEDDRETATSKEADAREMFECVICGQTAPSTDDNPIGMVALMQATGGINCAYSR